MKKILAVVIVLVGAAGGMALGVVLRPADGGHSRGAASGGAGEDSAEIATEYGASEAAGASHGGSGYSGAETSGGDGSSPDGEIESDRDFVKIGRQIIVPVVNEGETQALMLFDLALDVPSTMTERTYAAQPRLRDAFLRELFELSYTGAFSSTYTDERIVEEMRARLRRAARRLLGDGVAEVLILDIMRQEL